MKGDEEIDSALISSKCDYWETPQSFFDELNKEFHFTLDACATKENSKCQRFYDEEHNGLIQDWEGEVVFCNPPYSKKGKQDLWVKKCYEESQKPKTVVVALLPARTDTQRFHNYILGKATEIRYIKGRLFFELGGKPILDKKGRPTGAPFPSMVVIWKG